MKLGLKMQGLSETIANIGQVAGVNRSAKRSALGDVGSAIKKELRREIASQGSGSWAKPSIISQTKKKSRRAWGKSPITSKVDRNGGSVTVSTRGANTIMEQGTEGTGRRVKVSDKLRKYLAAMGVFLRKNMEYNIPARPLFGPVYRRMQGAIVRLFEERFHIQWSRKLRAGLYVK